MQVNVWNTMGELLEQFDSLREAEYWIYDLGYHEFARTYNAKEINISVHKGV